MVKNPVHRVLLVGCVLALPMQNAQSQTIANGPYYASPSWDQSLPAGSRFVVLSNFANEAVLDRETGLVWQRQPPSDRGPFLTAYSRCIHQSIGGKFGWRLPTITELGSLFDANVTAPPHILVGHPFILDTSAQMIFWSTTYALQVGSESSRFVFGFTHFTTRPTYGAQAEQAPFQSWCVRGPGEPGQFVY